VSSPLDEIARGEYIFGMITPDQIRGARGMLGLSQAVLAGKAGISTTALNNIERGAADPKVSTLSAIQSALEQAGATFADGAVKLRDFRVGDRVKYRLGRAPDRSQWHAIGEIIEVEQYPILQGPVPRVRAKIAGIESPWSMPTDFEFAVEISDGMQSKPPR
jgi:transcriptional regulator with XRE-family HTH domain